MKENIIILQQLIILISSLPELLGKDWPKTRRNLISPLRTLITANHTQDISIAVDQIIDVLLETPASVKVKAVLKSAKEEADDYSTTRSHRLRSDFSSNKSGMGAKAPGRQDFKRAFALGKKLYKALLSEAPVVRFYTSSLTAEEVPAIIGTEALPDEIIQPDGEGEKSISAWVSERSGQPDAPLTFGESYTLNFKVGDPVPVNALEGPGTEINLSEIPEAGLHTEWAISSSTIEIGQATSSSGVWTTSFYLHIPRDGESTVVSRNIIPRSLRDAQLEVLIYTVAGAQSRKKLELYRQFTVKVSVAGAPPQAAPPQVNLIHNHIVHAPASQLNLRTTHEWTTPPGTLNIIVHDYASAHVHGDVGEQYIDDTTRWHGVTAVAAGPINNVRASVEKFRARMEDYLNDIDPVDLMNRLQQFRGNYDWNQLEDRADDRHSQAWEAVQRSTELRDLAADGYSLYQAFFPAGTPLRTSLDALTPGHRINISWMSSTTGWLSHVPWGLMCTAPLPAPGDPVQATSFMGLRYRINYKAYPVKASKSLGRMEESYGAHLLYWGNQPQDATGLESDWQQKQLTGWTRQIIVPTPSAGTNAKNELLKMLDKPSPSPVAVLYLFCQCSVGAGNDPLLRFGSTPQASDVLRRTELGQSRLLDCPLVFANACSTAGADPYIANELERIFFDRGCRAYLGTEAKVPIAFASRFAFIFFNFFYRKVDPEPMAAGEAFAQAKLFLWTNYKNIGGLLYTYINQYDLFMADSAEISRLRL
jgi:hypothetical protein